MDRRTALRTLTVVGAAAGSVALLRPAAAQTTPVNPSISPAASSATVVANARPLPLAEYRQKTLVAGTLAKQTSELAQQRATDPRVKEFAGFEVAEQTGVAQVLTDQMNPPPMKLPAAEQGKLQALQELNGHAFDAAYVRAQIEGHQELLSYQQGYLNSEGRETDAQHIAILARFSIMQHLTMLQDIENQMKA